MYQKMNKPLLTENLVFPHNWSLKLYTEDIKYLGLENKFNDIIVKYGNMKYLDMYSAINGGPKKISNFVKRVYDVFSDGSILLYFEHLFMYLLKCDENETDEKILNFMNSMSKLDVMEWNSYVKRELKAASICMFITDPVSYFYNNDVSDEQMLKSLNLKVLYYDDIKSNIIGPSFLRTNLIKMYLTKHANQR